MLLPDYDGTATGKERAKGDRIGAFIALQQRSQEQEY